MVHFKYFLSPETKLPGFKKFNEPFPVHHFNWYYSFLMLLRSVSTQCFGCFDLPLQQPID